MITRIVEVTNGVKNWGKFMIGRLDADEHAYQSAVDGSRFLQMRWDAAKHVMVLDLETGEGGMFRLGGLASADLNKRKIWVCPMFEPFLEWLYKQDVSDPLMRNLPAHVDLPNAPFFAAGYRRGGPDGEGK